MSFVIADRVRETTTTTGTGTLSLDGAVAGFQAFTAVGNNNTTYYTIQGTTEWEVGIGTYLANTLSRDTVLSSSNGGSKLLLTAGTKDVFVTLPAGKTVISVAGKVGEVTLSNTDISGLGTMSTQNANSVAITGGTINGTTIGATTASTGIFTTLTINDNSTFGTSNSDTINFVGRINSDFDPATDNTYDLGRVGHKWRNLYIDGTANIDSLIADTADINAGTIDNTTIGATTPQSGSFVDLSVTGTTSFDGNQGTAGQVLTSAGTGATPTWTTPTTGTVTSVTGSSPVASSGGNTPAISLSANYGDTLNPYASKTAKYILAAPNAADGVPTFRAIVASDIPTLNQNTTGTASNVTGTVAVANGGTGGTTATDARTNLTAAKSGANTDITSVALTTGTISTAPSASTDIVNKTYADGLAAKWGA
jgi:hypothetical protein